MVFKDPTTWAAARALLQQIGFTNVPDGATVDWNDTAPVNVSTTVISAVKTTTHQVTNLQP